MSECTVCSRPAPDARLCSGCLDALKVELRALLPHWENRARWDMASGPRRELVPGLIAELDTTLTRQARIGERNGPRSTETPLPYHAAASVDLETIQTTLAMWCLDIVTKRGIKPPPAWDSVELAKWLLRYPTEAAQLEDAAELFENIHAMTKAARRTIDLAPDRRFLGPCDECGSELYIWCTPNRIPETVHCATEECSFSARVEERRGYLLEKAGNQLLTAAEMSRAIVELVPGQTRKISANTISQWASRGLSTTKGRETLTKFRHHPKESDCRCNPLANPPEPCRRPRFLVSEVLRFAHLDMGANDHTRKESA